MYRIESSSQTLEKVLNTILAANWVYQDWDSFRKTQKQETHAVKAQFCVLASELGYSNAEIGAFMHQRQKTIEHYQRHFKDYTHRGIVDHVKQQLLNV